MKSTEAWELLKKHPNASRLAQVIAWKARWHALDDGLEIGEALVGDWESYGMSESAYRSAKRCLQKKGYARFRAVKGVGTVAKFMDERLFGAQKTDQKGHNSDPFSFLNDYDSKRLHKTKSEERRPKGSNDDPFSHLTTIRSQNRDDQSNDQNNDLSNDLNSDPCSSVSDSGPEGNNGSERNNDDLNDDLSSDQNDDQNSDPISKQRRPSPVVNDDFLESGERKREKKETRYKSAAPTGADLPSLISKTSEQSASPPAELPLANYKARTGTPEQEATREVIDFVKQFTPWFTLITGKRTFTFTPDALMRAKEFFLFNTKWIALDVAYVAIKALVEVKKNPYTKGSDKLYWCRREGEYPNRYFSETQEGDTVLLRMKTELGFDPDLTNDSDEAAEIKRMGAPFLAKVVRT